MTGIISFNYFEAKEKIGSQVRVKNDFRDVPKGTIGTVVRTERMFDAFCVAITWYGLRGRAVITDVLSKYEYENHIEEVK